MAETHKTETHKKHASDSRMTWILYAVIAAIVVVAVVFAASKLIAPEVSVAVSLTSNTTVTYPYQTSYFDIVVNNTGSSAIRGLVVGFYLNGTAQHYSTVSIPSGKSATVVENYTYTTAGNYTFSAIADPAHVASVKDRNLSQSSMKVSIAPQEKPDIYTSLPGNGIAYTQSFTMSGRGLVSAAVTSDNYDLAIFNHVLTPAPSVLSKLYENLYVFVAAANGAYVRYSNNSTAYAMWMQGTLNPSLVDYVLSTFDLNQSTYSVNGTQAVFARIGNQTSICYLYSRGWTRIFTYDNESMPGTCRDFAGVSYASNETNAIVAQLKANKNLTNYQSKFFYTNSTMLGSGLTLGANSSLGGLLMFQNSYGFFTSYIQNTTEFHGTSPVCNGLIYNSSNASMCSVYVPQTTSTSQDFGMVNTTELTGNYRLSLYSLVNQSNLMAAHQNGVLLMNALNISNTISWASAFHNTCGISNASLGCNVTSFDYSNNTAHLRISSTLAEPLTINTFSCYAPGMRQNETVAAQLPAGGVANVSVHCYNLPLAIASVYTNFALAMNYTYAGATTTIAGVLNVTNPGLG